MPTTGSRGDGRRRRLATDRIPRSGLLLRHPLTPSLTEKPGRYDVLYVL